MIGFGPDGGQALVDGGVDGRGTGMAVRLYHRVAVAPSVGGTAWAYECGDAALLATSIASGDWLTR